jgi:hypothetical protein
MLEASTVPRHGNHPQVKTSATSICAVLGKAKEKERTEAKERGRRGGREERPELICRREDTTEGSHVILKF